MSSHTQFPNISEARTGIQELLAARAVGAIAENVKHISLKELLKSLEAELAEVGFSDASRDVGVSFSNICPNTTTGLSFKSFDINKVLEFGSPLLASDGQKRTLPERIPTGGDDPVADPQEGRPEEEEGDEDGHPAGNVQLCHRLQVVEEGKEEESHEERDPNRHSHPTHHPVRHRLRNDPAAIVLVFDFIFVVFVESWPLITLAVLAGFPRRGAEASRALERRRGSRRMEPRARDQ
ncbi:hypothetical protein ZIOFF_033096 [Zingiber officinale]|uniref:Uncharacterized protein n=1 Tax=Zingiber officinale TaxID=94328 RepID=A0A8J5GNN3_ZINOF|nr:hypothetical protein ZIOFF_033096 [Zingiber officinale]